MPFNLTIPLEPLLQISWLLDDAYPCFHLEFMLRRCHMLLNVWIYYKTALNVQCSNLMFQLICDKYFPIMAWQQQECSGAAAGRTADCSISRQFKPCVLGEARHCKPSLPLHTQQLQRFSCLDYLQNLIFYYYCFFNIYPNFYPGISILQFVLGGWCGTSCDFQ